MGRTAIRTTEVSPTTLGWTHLEGRTWRLPDGRFYVFAPTVRMVLILFSGNQGMDD